MPAGHVPVRNERDVALEIQEQVVARHDPAGEEISRHPVAVVPNFERVGKFPMREDVYEKCRVRCHPRCHALEQRVVIAHVLEHLHGHHAVEMCAGRERELVDVAGDHFEVAQAAQPRLLIDMQLLRA
jgi:hypothetical protein